MIIIGTRGSQLALWQAEYVRTCLERHHLGLDFQIKVIKTTGDKLQKNRVDDGVSKGAFTKEIDQAQFDGTIDLAVHSLKDLPVKLPVGISLGAIPTRNDPRDMLVSKIGTSLSHLPPNAKVGTHSLRRQSQLRYQRPDLEIVGIRGNIDTRVQKLRNTDLNAIILATAGLNRLYSSSHNKSPSLPGLQLTPIPTELMVPAAGQGALAITVRTDDKNMIDLVKNVEKYGKSAIVKPSLRVNGKIVSYPKKKCDVSTPHMDASSNGTSETRVRSRLNTSMAKIIAAMGALKIQDIAPAAAHPSSSNLVAWFTLKNLDMFELMAVPVITVGLSRPTEPPKPTVSGALIAEANI